MDSKAAWGSGDAHVQSTATRQPRLQAFGARGAPRLIFGFASKPSPSAPWARGLLSAFWERGSPDLPACGPRRGCASRPVQPIFINKAFKTLARGQASRGGRRKTSSGAASPGCLARSGEIKAGRALRGSNDASNDGRNQAGARARSVLVPSMVLRGKRRRRVPRHQAKVSISVQRDQDQQDGRTEVIVVTVTTRAFGR